MESFGFNLGDIIIVIILVFAGLMGLALGLVKAILFVASWVGAGLVTLYTYEFVKPYFATYIEKQLYVDIGAAVSVFVVSLLVFFWLCSRIWIAVRKSEFSGVDRSLGFFSGLIVGGFLICVVYLSATWMWGEKDLPALIGNAWARPYLQMGTNVIRNFLPGKTKAKAKNAIVDNQRRIRDAIQTERAMRRLLRKRDDASGNESRPDQKGYATPSRRDMDRLIESKQ